MAEKSISTSTKTALDLGPLILFFIGYFSFKDRIFTYGGDEYSGFIAVTAAFIPLLAITNVILWKLTGKISRMQVVTLVLVVVLGGSAVWFNDERFFKIKPTVVYLLFAGILGIGLLRGRSALHYVMADAIPLRREGWMIMTRRLTALFLVFAGVNELVWRTMSTDIWVTVKVFGFTIAIILFFFVNCYLLRDFLVYDGANSMSAGKDK